MNAILKTFAISIVCGMTVPEASCAGEPPPQIVAHRGLLRHAPENTLSNFRACLELRLGFEFDVSRTADGHLVCIHDDTVDRTTDGSGRVAELTLAQIRRLDAGSWFAPDFAGEKVPTVEEVLDLIARYSKSRVLVAVDLKAENAGRQVVDLARQRGVLNRLLFIGRTIIEPELRTRIRSAARNAHTAAVANNPQEFHNALNAQQADWVYVRFLPSREQTDAVHQAGKRCFIAGPTVSGHTSDNWKQAASAGVDGILTDYPLELRSLLTD